MKMSSEICVLKPVRPDDDEEVDCKGKTDDARAKAVEVEVDEVSDDIDQVQDQADHGQNDPGHHQSGFFLQQNQYQSKISF